MSARDDLIAAIDAYVTERGGGGGSGSGGTPDGTPGAAPDSPRRPLEGDERYHRRQMQEAKEKIKALEKLKDANVDQVALNEKLISQRKRLIEHEKEYKIALGISTVAVQENMAAKERAIQAEASGQQVGLDIAKRYFGVTNAQNHAFAQAAAGGQAFFQGVHDGFKAVMTPANILYSTLDKLVEATVLLAFAQDEAAATFAKNTGNATDFNDNIMRLERSLFHIGATSEDVRAAQEALFTTINDYTMMSEANQDILAETVLTLEKVGVSAENSAKNIQFATKVLGMSVRSAETLQRDLLTFARELGVSVDQIAGDFGKMQPLIAALGSKGVDAFKALEAQAKSTGLQIDELLGLVEKFDKFDTAAQSVGKLNALLGGPYLNTLELVAETDPSKRMEILKKRVDAAGLSFNSMDYYQRKALASAMGLNEVQLAMFMKGNLSQIMPTPKSAEQLIEIQKQTQAFNDVMSEAKQLFMALAVSLGPFISGIKVIFQTLQQVIQTLNGFLGVVGLSVSRITALSGVLYIATYVILPDLVKMVGAYLAPGLYAATGATVSLGTAMMTAGGIFVVVGFAAYKLAEYFGYTTEEAAALGIIAGILTGIFYLFSMGVVAATWPLMAFAAALSVIAIGIMVGFSPSVIFALGMMTLALIGLAFVIVPMLPALGTLALALGALSLVAIAVGSAFSKIVGEDTLNGLKLMAIEIANIVASINELSLTKAAAFTATFAATTVGSVVKQAASPAAVIPATVSAVSPSGMEKPTEMVERTSETAVARQAEEKVEASPAKAPEASGPPPVININLQIDGKELATVVNNVSVEKYSGGKPSEMYASIISMIEQGFVRGV